MKKMYESSERYEAQGYELLAKFLHRIVRGLYIFKTRKGEILAASGTFFLLISFTPILLILISLYGSLIGNVDVAYEHVINSLRENIPQIAPWIFKSVEKIAHSQLSGDNMNLLNIIVLGYASLGFSSSLNFGVGIISGRKQMGGVIFEDIKSIIGGISLGLFITALLLINSSPTAVVAYFTDLGMAQILVKLVKYDVVQAALTLVFFALFYKHMAAIRVRIIDAVLGSITFVLMFLLGKTFYWVYIHYVKDDLIRNFGNFYTIVVVCIWVYYLICSFYFGASVAYAPAYLRKSEEIVSDEVLDDVVDDNHKRQLIVELFQKFILLFKGFISLFKRKAKTPSKKSGKK